MTNSYKKPDADDLKARLRDWPYQGETMAGEAANCIEQLEAALTQSREEMAKLLAMNDAGYDTVTKRAVAAAYERAATEMELAAHIMSHHGTYIEEQTYKNSAKIVRAIATPDQTAALDKLIAEAVADKDAEIEQLNQDLSDMRDNAESAYRRGYWAGGNGA